ncbi:MAG: T9SS type A sorting domain-containing protein [Bacteroidota bacterium]|nr:T9SS type A sorting domain-containing protein [Bacteroidota bacterium]
MKIKYYTLTLILATLFTIQTTAQTTAMNFNRNDCNGNPQHLFADLNAGKAVIIEYFMTSCAPCPAAGQVLEVMKANLLAQYPGKIKSYAIAFNNTYSCSTVINWVNTYSFTSVPMDSGATQVAYYGGMGMPTIIIAAGSNHQLLGAPYIGFNNSDTTQMASNIRAFLNSQVGIKENSNSNLSLEMFPNPSNYEVHLNFNLKENSDVVIDVIDVMGRKISTLLSEKLQTGTVSKTFNASTLPNGNYFMRINANGVITHQKLSIVH